MQINTDVAVYDGNFRPYFLSKGNDFLAELYRFPSFLADNHTPWKRLAKYHPGYRFVLGRTYANEVDDLQGTLASANAAGLLGNVFAFETFLDATGTRYHLTRVDSAHLATLRKSAPRLSAMSPSEHEQFNAAIKRKRVCDHILAELAKPEELQIACIVRHKGCARYDMLKSIELAVAAHVVTIRRMPAAKRRKEILLLQSAERSIVNDTYLIQEALVLGCGIHTLDEKVKSMCKRVGVPLFPRTAAPGASASSTHA